MKAFWRVVFSFVILTLGIFFAGATPAPSQESPTKPAVHKLATTHLAVPPNFPKCGLGAVEHGDPKTGPAVLFRKLPPGCVVPWHWHSPNEHILMASGTLELQPKGEKAALLHSGDYALMPARHVHMVQAVGSTPSTFFLYSESAFDIHYVDDAGNEIPLEAALKAAMPKRARAKKQ